VTLNRAAVRWPSIGELETRAAEAAGLADFGPPTCRIGLGRFLQSLEQDAALSPPAADGVLALIRRRLANRLKIEDWRGRHAEAANAQVRGPVSITGLHRTGTTALGNMMSLDPQFRNLRVWEQAEPCPPPTTAGEAADPRRLREIANIERLGREQPEQLAMHLYDADATVEDHELMGLEFASHSGVLPIFGYHRWWRTADLTDAFAYHRRALQLLQSERPPNLWLLKAPHHMFHLQAIVAAYPDARFVFTHRDPAKAIPSYLSFATSFYPRGAVEQHGRSRIGRLMHAHFVEGTQRALAARAAIGEDRFLDVRQRDVARDPIGVLERVYDFLGLPFTGAFADAVTCWNARNREGAHGSHSYKAEDWGLTPREIRADYAFYGQRFGFD
jgi:hypothetical protein